MKIIEGDFHKGGGVTLDKKKRRVTLTAIFSWEHRNLTDITHCEELSQENAKSVLGTIGWGAAGAVALGGLGLLAGVLCGGNKSLVTFALRFRDGKVAICQGKRKELLELQMVLGDL